ncbi:DUF5462 family protein [Moritella sp. 36]|uniref:DUF5462 family protein n=1 Tax=Moritella sp. 36 TaxID=2746233 RepID=UPI001BA933E7|nr:DUF5462 family protein [Moritella sp. 36]QUM88178.1 DUF5462 family protein [Moritella sp. 36]
MKKTIGWWLGIALLVNGSVIAQELSVTPPSVSLGVVNGDIVNDRIEIKKLLSNPTLLTVKQSELDAPLKSLSVKNATLLKNQQGEVTMQLDAGNQIRTIVTLSLWLDGEKTGFHGTQSGSIVALNIPEKFERLEVKAITHMTITLHKSYRGGFKFRIDMEGGRLLPHLLN